MTSKQDVKVFVNQQKIPFENAEQTGQSVKEAASIPLGHVLFTGHGRYDKRGHCDEDLPPDAIDHTEIFNDQVLILKNGQHFWSEEPKVVVEVTINREVYYFDSPTQTGHSLKERASIDLGDVLFRSQPAEDEVIPNDAEIILRCGDCFYSSPPANYGSTDLTPNDVGCEQFKCVTQPGGWSFLVIPDFHLPKGYSHNTAQLLVKLPPGFPDAAPDMFWVNPQIRTQSGGVPQGTSFESLLGEQWQRFSWHLTPGAWRPGISTLRDFMRCVRSRFERRN